MSAIWVSLSVCLFFCLPLYYWRTPAEAIASCPVVAVRLLKMFRANSAAMLRPCVRVERRPPGRTWKQLIEWDKPWHQNLDTKRTQLILKGLPLTAQTHGSISPSQTSPLWQLVARSSRASRYFVFQSQQLQNVVLVLTVIIIIVAIIIIISRFVPLHSHHMQILFLCRTRQSQCGRAVTDCTLKIKE